MIIEVAHKGNFLGSKKGQCIAYAQNMINRKHCPRILAIIIYVDSTCGLCLSLVQGVYAFRPNAVISYKRYGFSDLYSQDDATSPRETISKVIQLVRWWCSAAIQKLLLEKASLPQIGETDSVIRAKLVGENIYKYYDTSKKDPGKIMRRPDLYTLLGKMENIRVITIQEHRLLLEYKRMEGKHGFSDTKQIRCLVSHLIEIHDKGFVHGDIRLSNIVCSGDVAYFIDFDYSGKENEHTYPQNWNIFISDGQRHKDVKSGGVLRKQHDLHALLYILQLFKCESHPGYQTAITDYARDWSLKNLAQNIPASQPVSPVPGKLYQHVIRALDRQKVCNVRPSVNKSN